MGIKKYFPESEVSDVDVIKVSIFFFELIIKKI